MNNARAIELTGVVMLIVAVVALVFNIQMLAIGKGEPTVTSLLAVVVAVAGVVYGEIRRDA